MSKQQNKISLQGSRNQSDSNQGEVLKRSHRNQIQKDKSTPPHHDSQIGNNSSVSKINVNTPCAFHKHERITNFCKNKQCLLPLCPRCVKIHTDQHVKMGSFGDFETIEEVIKEAENGLAKSFSKTDSLKNTMVDIKNAYEKKIMIERKKIREARNVFMEEVEKIFDLYEKALFSSSLNENKEFIDELYNAQNSLSYLIQNCESDMKKMQKSHTLMQGIINYFSNIKGKANIEKIQSKLKKLFPESVELLYKEEQLDRLQGVVKRYLDFGVKTEIIKKEIQTIKEQKQQSPTKFENKPKNKAFERENQLETLSKDPKYEKYAPEIIQKQNEPKRFSNNIKTLEKNDSLIKFKTPLQNFSLSKSRKTSNSHK